jgi:predicted  nucleic acid-binding Zn-ribbon protein
MNKTTITKISLLSTIALALVFSTSVPSYAGQFAKNHPRRAQVLNRANHEAARINTNRGHLNGHYNQLSKEDNHIRRQEQRDARANGGHITKQEQNKLNHEENRLNNQIRHDK